MKSFDDLKRYIMGAGEWQQKNTPGGYSSSYVQTEPNIIGKAGNAIKGGFSSLLQGLKEKFDPNTIAGFTPKPEAQPIVQEVMANDVPYKHSIPTSHSMGEIPQQISYQDVNGEDKTYDLAQGLMEAFDDIKQATPAGEMLAHSFSQTRTQDELDRGMEESWNYGENPNFKVIKNDLQDDGTTDMGLTRNNTGTFDDMMKNIYWRNRMANKGITEYSDINDPQKSIDMARLTLENSNWNPETQAINDDPNWRRWYASLLKNRQ